MDNNDNRAVGAGLAPVEKLRVSRRDFFKKASAGAAVATLGVATITTAEARVICMMLARSLCDAPGFS